MRSIKEIYPQGTLVSVTEQGLFEDFVLKSKERMCGRAQLEIMRITEQLTQKFVENADNLSTANKKRLKGHHRKRETMRPLWICGLYLYGRLQMGQKAAL